MLTQAGVIRQVSNSDCRPARNQRSAKVHAFSADANRAGRRVAWAATKLRPDETLIRALARAHRWKRLLEEGTHRSAHEIAEMTWKRRGGRKVIIAPDGGDAWAPASPSPDEALIRALARRIGSGC